MSKYIEFYRIVMIYHYDQLNIAVMKYTITNIQNTRIKKII